MKFDDYTIPLLMFNKKLVRFQKSIPDKRLTFCLRPLSPGGFLSMVESRERGGKEGVKGGCANAIRNFSFEAFELLYRL